MREPVAARHSAARPRRAPQEGVPPTKAERDRLGRLAREHMAGQDITPPLGLDEIYAHVDRILERAGAPRAYRKWLAVVAGNEVWRDTLASIPYERRLLLLPQCLRDEERCAGQVDEFGLLCARCGACPIAELQEEAERLGYAVLVAEGTAVVTSLFESGQIQGVVGVSCLSVLERVFPYVTAAAVPGVAVPLLQDGCAGTSVDLDWVWEAILLTKEEKISLLDLDGLRTEVDSWFTPDFLPAIMGPAGSEAEELARSWLAKSGKRWRPFLAVCAYQAFQADPRAALPQDLRKIAVAVECFHKASLVHDDIEDHDGERYGEKTLHEAYGIPVALNVGDLLLGEGYRMIAESEASAPARAEMLRAASSGHRSLCIGQGEELAWMRQPRPLFPEDVLAIFRQKTAPAFDVALRLGAIYAGVHDHLWDILGDYSEALGIAYQIRDDLEDFRREAAGEDGRALGPSLLLAIAYQRATGPARGLLESVWRCPMGISTMMDDVSRILDELQVDRAASLLLESYKEQAIRSLCRLRNPHLKGLLRRVISKIFDGINAKGRASDLTPGDAPGRRGGPEAAG
ncbi:MAG: polyprenyl synthetase family protein [Candidatus Brocadiia bacterium]